MDVLDSKEKQKVSDIKYDKEDWEGKFFMMKKTAEFLAKKVPFWISTKEENPTSNERVLVYHSGYGITVGFMHTWGEWDIKQAYPENPTHWMPLPEPPKEE